jgi:predicted HNH restriction endonuclease
MGQTIEYPDVGVCGFDFAQTYGDRGKGFIECHHIVPLHVAAPVGVS